jgi:hypothetical protein
MEVFNNTKLFLQFKNAETGEKMEGYLEIDEEMLKRLAKMYGYSLIKIKPYEKFEPCICGCNRRRSWSCWNRSADDSIGYKGHYVKLECRRCGQTVTGENDAEAKHNWNEYMMKIKRLRELRSDQKEETNKPAGTV